MLVYVLHTLLCIWIFDIYVSWLHNFYPILECYDTSDCTRARDTPIVKMTNTFEECCGVGGQQSFQEADGPCQRCSSTY